jgi:hypothetical protein
MNELFKHIKADKIIKWGMTLATGILILEIAYILIVYRALPPFLPLFNQMPWGEERLGDKIEIFLPVVITVAFAGVNVLLIARLYTRMPLASRILSITTLLITVLSCIFVTRTLLLIV